MKHVNDIELTEYVAGKLTASRSEEVREHMVPTVGGKPLSCGTRSDNGVSIRLITMLPVESLPWLSRPSENRNKLKTLIFYR